MELRIFPYKSMAKKSLKNLNSFKNILSIYLINESINDYLTGREKTRNSYRIIFTILLGILFGSLVLYKPY
jgi:hypothetical protein